MTWFWLSVVGPFLYALTNHIDKILLEKYFKEQGVGTLILFSALLSATAIPFIFLLDTSVLDVDRKSVFYLTIVSVLNLVVLWSYLLALMDEEATVVIVFYQLVPVFGALMGYTFLGEVLSADQLWAMAIVLIGTTIVSFEFEGLTKIRFKRRTVLFMCIASFSWATETTIFKAVALEENVWRSVFWEHVTLVALGGLIFALVPSYRASFINAWRMNSRPVLSLNFANEALYMVGNITVSYAVMLAPIALILLAESFQSTFVFIFGMISTILIPKYYKEQIGRVVVLQKLSAIALTGYGAYWLVSVTP